MNIKAISKGFFELRNISHMGEHAQFDLAVIGTNQLFAFGGNEGGADAPAIISAHGDVLQIRIRGRKPAGGCRSHRIGGVHTPGFRVDKFGQRIGVSGTQLGQLPPIQHALGQVNALGRQIIKRVRVCAPRAGCGFATAGQLHFIVKNFT